MKKIILKNGLFFLMGGLIITSCVQESNTSDKENTETPNNTEETINNAENSISKIKYKISLSKTYFDFFDINAEYTDESGNTVNKVLTDNLDLNIETVDKFSEVNIKVTAKPKDKRSLPEIDNSKVYKFKKGYHIKIESQTSGIKNMNDSTTLPINGSKLKDFASKEYVLVSQSYNCMQ